MDALDYMERESADTLKELMRDYAASFERVLKVATTLAGGSAALVAYTSGADLPALMRGALLVVAAVWALGAAYVVLWGGTSNYLESGAAVRQMQQRYLDEGGKLMPYDGSNASALAVLRLAELNRRHEAEEAYAKALNKRADALNLAIVGAALAAALAAVTAACSL